VGPWEVFLGGREIRGYQLSWFNGRGAGYMLYGLWVDRSLLEFAFAVALALRRILRSAAEASAINNPSPMNYF
jgi:hypothetical protein